MIDLIGLSFAVFVFGILVIRFARRMREIREIRHKQTPLSIPLSHRKPSDDFHDQTWLPLCTTVASTLSSKVNRPLTPHERRAIWRSRSPLVLEALLQDLQSATPDSAASLLASLPPGMTRPDPTNWCGLFPTASSYDSNTKPK